MRSTRFAAFLILILLPLPALAGAPGWKLRESAGGYDAAMLKTPYVVARLKLPGRGGLVVNQVDDDAAAISKSKRLAELQLRGDVANAHAEEPAHDPAFLLMNLPVRQRDLLGAAVAPHDP